jgi:hypothetical protein
MNERRQDNIIIKVTRGSRRLSSKAIYLEDLVAADLGGKLRKPFAHGRR